MPAAPQRRTAAWQAALIALLALGALVCAALAVQAWLDSRAAKVPLSLTPLPDGGLWLTTSDEIWQVDALGRLRRRLSIDESGLPVPPSQMVATPSGRLLAGVPGQADLILLDNQGQAQDRLPLQWPASLRPTPDRPHAPRLAVHPDGRIATTAGTGGHLVVFDERGGLLQHTAVPGMTDLSALWWDGEELWAADAAQAVLLRLSARDLTVRDKVQLSDKGRGLGCLLHAVPHPRHGIELHAPLATVSRVNCRTGEGRVSDVWRDGLEQAQPQDGWARPEDLAWLGDTLVVAEGRTGRLQRFNVDREKLSTLGDADLQAALDERRAQRDEIGLKAIMAGLGAVMLLLGAGLLNMRRRPIAVPPDSLLSRPMMTMPSPAPPPAAAATLGQPTPPAPSASAADGLIAPETPPTNLETVMRHEARFLGSPLSPVPPSGKASRPGRLAVLLGLPAAQRAAESPSDEAWINAGAVHALLHTPAFLRDREPGEQPRETLMLSTAQGECWLLVTNRRVLAYQLPRGGEPVLLAGSRRDELHDIAIGRAAGRPRGRRWRQPGLALRLRFNDGRVLQGWAPSAVTARRLVALLAAGLARA